jgi:hypothetical protein
MVRAPKKPEDLNVEPGADDRFTRGIRRALETPPKTHDEMKDERLARRKSDQTKKGRPSR